MSNYFRRTVTKYSQNRKSCTLWCALCCQARTTPLTLPLTEHQLYPLATMCTEEITRCPGRQRWPYTVLAMAAWAEGIRKRSPYPKTRWVEESPPFFALASLSKSWRCGSGERVQWSSTGLEDLISSPKTHVKKASSVVPICRPNAEKAEIENCRGPPRSLAYWVSSRNWEALSQENRGAMASEEWCPNVVDVYKSTHELSTHTHVRAHTYSSQVVTLRNTYEKGPPLPLHTQIPEEPCD